MIQVYLSSPAAGAATALASAITSYLATANITGVTVTTEPWGTNPHSVAAGRWVLITPQGKRADSPWPQTKWFGIVDLDFPPAEQLTQALELLGFGPGMNDPAGKM